MIHVGYLAQNETLQFCINLSEALMDEAAKYGKKVEVDMIDARGLAPQQVSQAEDMAIRDVDVVIISPIDQDANAPCIDILTEKGIPVVLVNTFTTNSELATSFVGCDDKEAGVIEVQLMSDVLGGEGKINVMSGTHGDPANEKRIQGMNDELANHPGIEIVQEQAADWDRGKAMSLTEDWLMSGREFDGVIAMNDEMAVSCQLALNTAGRENIKVVGVDAIDEALKMIKDGTLYGTVFQDADTQGRGSLNVAVAIALGQEVEPNYIIPYEGVTADNVDNYMK